MSPSVSEPSMPAADSVEECRIPWVVVLFLSAVNLAFIPNLINRNTEEIL